MNAIPSINVHEIDKLVIRQKTFSTSQWTCLEITDSKGDTVEINLFSRRAGEFVKLEGE